MYGADTIPRFIVPLDLLQAVTLVDVGTGDCEARTGCILQKNGVAFI